MCFQDENYLGENNEYRFQSHDDFTKEIFEEITDDNDDTQCGKYRICFVTHILREIKVQFNTN